MYIPLNMTIPHEFSRPITVEGIVSDKAMSVSIVASAEECAALAERFDLQSLSGLKGKVTILRVSEGKIIRVEGTIEAQAVQTCVVSLQAVPSRVRTAFDTYFTEDGDEGDAQDFSLELEDEVSDVMADGILDLGELVAQYLSLELDPYPRAPGVSLAAQLAESGTDIQNRPFQILQGLKPEKEE